LVGVAVFLWGGKMAYTITGTATFSSTAFRDAALSRVQTAVASYTYNNVATPGFSAGIQTPTATTLTVSIQNGNDDSAAAAALAKAIYDAWTASNRHSSGFLSINRT
jgi:hypothetical protein